MREVESLKELVEVTRPVNWRGFKIVLRGGIKMSVGNPNRIIETRRRAVRAPQCFETHGYMPFPRRGRRLIPCAQMLNLLILSLHVTGTMYVSMFAVVCVIDSRRITALALYLFPLHRRFSTLRVATDERARIGLICLALGWCPGPLAAFSYQTRRCNTSLLVRSYLTPTTTKSLQTSHGQRLSTALEGHHQRERRRQGRSDLG